MGELALPYIFIPLFFITAFLFSSVGHGGASGYLALFALTGFARSEITPIVLFLNIIVSSNSFINFFRAKYFSYKLLLPFLIGSVPGAFIGGVLVIPKEYFLSVLSMTLLFAAFKLLFYSNQVVSRWKDFSGKSFLYATSIGFAIGILSGITGIGGGVFFSPFLLMSNWANAKQTAAVSAAFIALNSLAALLGKAFSVEIHWNISLLLGLVVLIGGHLGSYFGANKFNSSVLQKILGIALLIAGLKLIKDLVF